MLSAMSWSAGLSQPTTTLRAKNLRRVNAGLPLVKETPRIKIASRATAQRLPEGACVTEAEHAPEEVLIDIAIEAGDWPDEAALIKLAQAAIAAA
jgi:hypothetical protein